MEKLNAETIKKALECCSTPSGKRCENCPKVSEDALCMYRLSGDALALIKQQDEQIFQLENRLKECENGYSQTLGIERARIKELTEENERLKSEVSVKKKLLDKCVDPEDRVRADTVKRFAERLKKECLVDSGYEVLQIGTIDRIAEEILNKTEDEEK